MIGSRARGGGDIVAGDVRAGFGSAASATIRAAAKNHAFVTVVVDVADYPALLAELELMTRERNDMAAELAVLKAQAKGNEET